MSVRKKKLIFAIMIVPLALMLILNVIFFSSPKYDTVTEYLADPDMQGNIQKKIDEKFSVDTEELTVNLHADGNTLVYECRFKVPLDLSDPALAAETEETFAQIYQDLSPVCEELINELRPKIKTEGVQVRVTFANAYGSVLYSEQTK